MYTVGPLMIHPYCIHLDYITGIVYVSRDEYLLYLSQDVNLVCECRDTYIVYVFRFDMYTLAYSSRDAYLLYASRDVYLVYHLKIRCYMVLLYSS